MPATYAKKCQTLVRSPPRLAPRPTASMDRPAIARKQGNIDKDPEVFVFDFASAISSRPALGDLKTVLCQVLESDGWAERREGRATGGGENGGAARDLIYSNTLILGLAWTQASRACVSSRISEASEPVDRHAPESPNLSGHKCFNSSFLQKRDPVQKAAGDVRVDKHWYLISAHLLEGACKGFFDPNETFRLLIVWKAQLRSKVSVWKQTEPRTVLALHAVALSLNPFAPQPQFGSGNAPAS
ncbi:hypothetical protein B0H14DRAFT_2622848 [Mycena olivaceomarginata]|nr:hypothetical protein B0H14DRAFT_2622848 [Mycena olivaceomarginata]